jgi:hypothetical protein
MAATRLGAFGDLAIYLFPHPVLVKGWAQRVGVGQ